MYLVSVSCVLVRPPASVVKWARCRVHPAPHRRCAHVLVTHRPTPPSAPHPPFPSASICPVCSGAMYLMKTEDGCYTLKKVDAKGLPTSSAHPARFSPDDKFSRHRVTLKKRFGKFCPCFRLAMTTFPRLWVGLLFSSSYGASCRPGGI